MSERQGPVEVRQWSDQIEARVVSPGANPRAHGYAIEDDLALHYSFSEQVYLSLCGVLPDQVQAGEFEIALSFLSPISIGSAPTHAAMLAKLCGSQPSAVHGTGLVALTEQARFLVAAHALLLEDLPSDEASRRLPCSPDSDERILALKRLDQALQARALPCGAWPEGGCREAALLSLLMKAGLKEPWQLEAAIVFARFPLLSAEANHFHTTDLKHYPIDLPAFEYQEEGE